MGFLAFSIINEAVLSTEDWYLMWLLLQSLVDEAGLNSINSVASKCAKALASGDGKLATSFWDEAERVIDGVTSGVNLYNILKWDDDSVRRHNSSKLRLFVLNFEMILYIYCI